MVLPGKLTALVVIGRNEGSRLSECLASIDPDLPRVYVDSGSTDDSVSRARKSGAPVLELHPGAPFTAARARAEGFDFLIQRHANLEFVQFIDGDCCLHKGWLEDALQAMSCNPQLGAVCGRRSESYPEASFYNALFDKEWDTPVGKADSTGGDSLVRVSAYREAGGFRPDLTAGEEPEFSFRLRQAGWQIERLDSAMTMHDADVHRFEQWWQRAKRSGYGYFQAFHATRNGYQAPLYRRELIRAISWAVGVPLFSVILAIMVHPALLLLTPGIWGLQWVRLALRHGARHAALLLVGKAAESIGAFKAWRDTILKIRANAIRYK